MLGKSWCARLRVAWFALIALSFGGAPAVEAQPVKSLLEMRQEHVVIQKWDFSCGAAGLATVLNYQYDDPVSEREIAKAMVKREEYIAHPQFLRAREGFSLLDLKRYLDQRGYEGIGYGKMSLDDLIERAPALVPIRVNGYNHFVIFRGIWQDRVLLADPGWGNRTMSTEKFESAWIEYPNFGRVGFVVARTDGTTPVNRLAPRPEEFLALK
jgi:predicted double-glycine peptidase